jgi:hypothetical protein
LVIEMGDVQPKFAFVLKLMESAKECHTVGPARNGHENLPVREQFADLAGEMAGKRMPVHGTRFSGDG